jgi:PleD family two-component response regulator
LICFFILYRTVIIHTIYMSSRQKILVIDDEFDNALTIKMPLNARRISNVDVFTDSITALNNFQADY